MAVMQSRNNRSYNAGGDLSAAQFKFVKVSGANVVVAATLGEVCLGAVSYTHLTLPTNREV